MLLVVAVRGALALEVVPLHRAGEALALGDRDRIDALARSEQPRVELLADLVAVGVVDPELDELLARLHPGGLEVARARASRGSAPFSLPR